MGARPVAVVLDGPPGQAWQQRALEAIEAVPDVTVAVVQLAGAGRLHPLDRLRTAVDRRLFWVAHDPSTPVAVAERAPRSADVELVIWLAERPPEVAGARDVLYLRHDGRAEPAADAVARAIAAQAGWITTEVVLRRGDGSEATVARTVSGVRAYSETVTRTFLLWKLAALVPRSVARLADGSGGDGPLRPSGSPASLPTPLRRLTRAAIAWGRVLATRLLFRRPWSVVVRPRASAPAAGWRDAPSRPLVRWGSSPVYADPVLFEHENRHHLFVEEVPAGTGRGVISHTELHLDGRPAEPPRPVLTADHHLSYPFVFRHDGEIFMVPETSAARRVELHRAVDFPRSWALEAILLDDVDAADATIVEHDGLLWMFVAIAPDHGSSLDELHVFWAERLRGPWRPHAANPVVSDVRGARPAGPVQRWEGRLVRPAQDGSRRYGGAVSFRQIDVLTRSEYAEREVARIEPSGVGPGVRAVHHHARDSAFEAIDVRRRLPRLRIGRRRRAL